MFSEGKQKEGIILFSMVDYAEEENRFLDSHGCEQKIVLIILFVESRFSRNVPIFVLVLGPHPTVPGLLLVLCSYYCTLGGS